MRHPPHRPRPGDLVEVAIVVGPRFDPVVEWHHGIVLRNSHITQHEVHPSAWDVLMTDGTTRLCVPDDMRST